MPDLDRFLGWDGRGPDHVDSFDRAASTDYLIGRNPTSLVLVRSTGPLSAQTALVLPASRSRIEVEGEAGESSLAVVAVIGLRGHATKPDLDIARGDRFRYPDVAGGRQYEVTHVDTSMPGKVEAHADVTA